MKRMAADNKNGELELTLADQLLLQMR